MYNDNGVTVVRKRVSFPAATAIGVTAIIVTAIVSASGIALYGIRVVDKKSDGILRMVSDTVKSLPDLQKALPPVLADAIDDVRRPDYIKNMSVSVRPSAVGSARGCYRATVEVENCGDQTVSYLSMRIVGLDETGDPVAERCTWAATPVQIEDEWRGPLLPHETRRFPVYWWGGEEPVELTYEITDIRIWREKALEQIDARVTVDTASRDSGPLEQAGNGT